MQHIFMNNFSCAARWTSASCSTSSTASRPTADTCSTWSSCRPSSRPRANSSKMPGYCYGPRRVADVLKLLLVWVVYCLWFNMNHFFLQLVNSGEDVLVFLYDRSSFQTLGPDDAFGAWPDGWKQPPRVPHPPGGAAGHLHGGQNVYTEIKCNSLLPLDDIVRVVTHKDCIPEVSGLQFHAA